MKNFVVTGATSFIGKNFIEKALKNGDTVNAVVRPNSKNRKGLTQSKNLKIIELDIAEISRLSDLVQKSDVFVHLAWGGTDPTSRNNPETQKANVKASVSALKTAIDLGCEKFLFAGSQAEYGIHKEPINEKTTCCPISEYGKAKLAFGQRAEKLCSGKKISFIHLRIFSAYGAGDHHKSLINSCVDVFENGGVLKTASLKQIWNYVHIKDLVEQIMRLSELENKAISTYSVVNLASNDTRKLLDFVQSTYDLSSKKGFFLIGARHDNPEGTAWLNPDISKLKRLTGWEQEISFEDGIKEMIDLTKTRNV
ncbi:MAG TPA: NAD(P)-dependent oxidoreductase [Clostridia bacterium]|nr:NAD(P)-dependent oxidoreductase [Clostridia bacterium]